MDYGALLDALRGVTWPARRAARFGTAGTHPSRLRGLSAEFTEYRPYRQGDDPRRLDWKLLARTDKAFLRITSDRATLGTLVCVDASASMFFPAPSFDKWNHARALAVGLAQVAHAAGDPVGLLVFGGAAAARVESRTRRGIVAEIARALDAAGPPDARSEPFVPHAVSRAPRIAIVGDFLGEPYGELLQAARRRVAAGGEVFAVHVVAREEADPASRSIMARDPESPDVQRPLVDETRQGYLAAFGDWRRATARAWREAGATFGETLTDESPARAVRRIAQGSRQRVAQ